MDLEPQFPTYDEVTQHGGRFLQGLYHQVEGQVERTTHADDVWASIDGPDDARWRRIVEYYLVELDFITQEPGGIMLLPLGKDRVEGRFPPH